MGQTISDYTAVLLAAGRGLRISDMTDKPKCLLEVQGKTLLERHFEIWKRLGIGKVNLVLGHEKKMITQLAEKYLDDFKFNMLDNADYERQGNAYSLYIGVKDIDGPSLIFDADLIYEESILQNFLQDHQMNQLLVGSGSLEDIESAKTLVDSRGYARMTVDKRLVCDSELKRFRFVGEAIGILKFSKEQTIELSTVAGLFLSDEKNIPLNWEHLLNLYFSDHEVGVHMFEQGKWMEIDTSEDFKHAQELFKN